MVLNISLRKLHFLQYSDDSKSVTASVRIPSSSYPSQLFVIDGPYIRNANAPNSGLVLNPSDKSVATGPLSPGDILCHWRRVQPNASVQQNAGSPTAVIIDIPRIVDYIGPPREFQMCEYSPILTSRR